MCSSVSYGRVNPSSSNNTRLFGFTNIQRIGLFLRDCQVLQSVNLLGKPTMPGGVFKRNEYLLRAPREVLVFSDAQRFNAWTTLRSLHSDGIIDVDLMVYDIGGRDYECNYLTVLTTDVIMKYTVYDKNEIVDVKRGIKIEHEEVSQNKLTDLMELGSVLIFNSFYMTFTTRAALEASLTSITTTKMKKGSYVFLSFYVMSTRIRDLMKEFKMIDAVGCVAPDFKFSFGRYNAVATTSDTFVSNWITALTTANFDCHNMYVSQTELVDSAFYHGYGFSIDAIQMYQLFNCIQHSYLLVYKGTP